MDAGFNPYREWLGLDGSSADVSYYELLGLEPGEKSAEKITAAVDRAIAKVRSCRPGAHAVEWADLLDELTEAQRCLLDARQRQQYDAQLADAESGSSRQPSTDEIVGSARAFPPGTAGSAKAGPPTVPLAQQGPTVPLPSPLAPTASPSQGVPMASYPAAPMAAAPNPMDPMAPVGVGYPSTQPTSHPAPTAAFPASGPATLLGQRPAAGGAKSPVAEAVARKKKKSNSMVVMFALAAGTFTVCAGIVLMIVKDRSGGKTGQEEETVAQQTDTVLRETRKQESERKRKPFLPEVSPAAPKPPLVPPAVDPAPSPAAPAPVPDPPPMPDPPDPPPMPTPQELAALSQALESARLALAEKNPEAALVEVAKAQQLARLDPHKAMVSRLEKVAGLVQEFWAAVDRARSEMTALDEIDLPTGNRIVVVESSPELLIVKINGQSRRFTRRQESTKFASVIADRVLPREDPHSRIVKGAAFVVEANQDWRGEGVHLWKEAAGFSDERTDLLEYLEDDYDLRVE